ncbi:MAG: hypothetical protein CVU39_20040 [Chloroflexi bacterium HGW-Chloroflexi-10]|nr:MAG: hypothetical protein CVU39_20040 [Chloroflexi bacterium HGW-Chloroflexi-10]
MPQTTRTFRVFISSTFSDLKEERGALQTYVFPRLRELAMAHGCRFQAIDLRWGVSEEAALDQQTMKICLGEIGRCQQISPRPNFLILLGDRFGWRPLPYSIPVEEFECLLPHLTEAEQKLACWQSDGSGWYRRDDNAIPAEYVLQPRRKGSRWEEYEVWENEVERPLVIGLERAAHKADLPKGLLVKYTYSATGQEIVRGALSSPDAQSHVFAFFRGIINANEADQSFVEIDHDLRLRQEQLKSKLRNKLPGNIYEFAAHWNGSGVDTDYIGSLPENLEICLKICESDKPRTLCESVWLHLSQLILSEIRNKEIVSSLEKELQSHEIFARERTEMFVGRSKILQQIDEYIQGKDRHVLALIGNSGSGKSAIIAKACQASRNIVSKKGSKSPVIIQRFIGATPESTDGKALLEGLRRQIVREYGGEDTVSSTTFNELVIKFSRSLTLATANRPLFIFLDALDQLNIAYDARVLSWIPVELPRYVHLIVSTLPDDCVQPLQARQAIMMNIPPMDLVDGAELLDNRLQNIQRQLTKEQKDLILKQFQISGGLPLYLKVAFEQARHWHSFSEPYQLGESVGGVLVDYFHQLEQENYHGKELVSAVLGFLAASKNGLNEDELLDILWKDYQVRLAFFRRSPKSPTDVQSLPIVIWARLFFDLEPFLNQREADDSSVLVFYHRQVGEAARTLYLRPGCHAVLSDYFFSLPIYLDNKKQILNLRKLSEMVYQQINAGQMERFIQTMLDFNYLMAKVKGHAIQDLVKEYGQALETDIKQSDHIQFFKLIRETLLLSSSILESKPDQLTAHLYARLMGLNNRHIFPVLEQARLVTRTPWLHPLHPCLEPPGGPLLQTFMGHNMLVNLVKFMPGGQAVSWSMDRTIKIWDLASGACLRTLSMDFWAVAITQDCQFAISVVMKKHLHVWDLITGICLRTFDGPYFAGVILKISPDGKFAFSHTKTKAMEVIDLQNGTVLHSIRAHDEFVEAAAIAPNSWMAVTGAGGNLKLWDLRDGNCLGMLKKPASRITNVIFSTDGKQVIAACELGIIFRWDVESGSLLNSIQTNRLIKTLAISSDSLRLVTGDSSNQVIEWDLQQGTPLQVLDGHSQPILSLDLSSDGQMVITGGGDNTVKLWNLRNIPSIKLEPGHAAAIASIAFTSDGKRVLTTSMDKTIKIWDSKSLKNQLILQGHTEKVNQVAITSDGLRAVSASDDNTLRVWNMINGACQLILQGHKVGVNSIAITPDDKKVVSASSDCTLRVWDLLSGICLKTLEGHKWYVYKVILTPDGRKIISSSRDTTIKVWDLESGACLQTFAGHSDAVNKLVITPDGRNIISSSWDKQCRMWNINNGACLTLDCQNVNAVSPDGRLVVSIPNVEIWELESKQILTGFTGDYGGMTCCAFAADGLTLAAGDASGRIYTFRMENFNVGTPIVTARSLIQKSLLWKKESFFFECPICTKWADVPKTVLGKDSSCPKCGKQVRFNPFTIAS